MRMGEKNGKQVCETCKSEYRLTDDGTIKDTNNNEYIT